MPCFFLAEDRTTILHVVADLTAYRISASTSLSAITRRVLTLREEGDHEGYEPHLWAYYEDLSDWATSRWGTPEEKVLQRVTRALNPAYDRLLSLEAERLSPVVLRQLHLLASEGLLKEHRNGKWSLTREGIVPAADVRSQYERTNVTAAWIHATVDGPYLADIVADMKVWCFRSTQFNEVEELVHNYLANLLRRNGLLSRISEARYPTPSDLKGWAYRAAQSQWRDEGRDALTRGMKGCRTEKDLRMGDGEETHQDTVDRSLPPTTQGVFLSVDDQGHESPLVSSGHDGAPLLDVVDGNFEDEIIHHLTWTRGVAMAEAVIRKEKPGAAERFSRIFRLIQDGAGLQEIGDAENVSRNRAAALVNDLRDAVLRAVANTSLALQVLRFVQNEPCATVEDMEAPREVITGDDGEEVNVGGLGEEIPQEVLNSLVAAKRLSRLSDGCYVITKLGEASIASEGGFLGIEMSL